MSKQKGSIITFYSYKGGVGRTMALANAAFLAAFNGHRVLVMDWDLEAPGLAYYFRGLLDGNAAREMKEAPGVLDFLWEWSSKVSNLGEDSDLNGFIHKFFDSKPFDNCVRSLADPELLPSIRRFDYIGSGARVIEHACSKSYEEALASFSWQDFFEEQAGGFLLERLKLWARERYDYIFIDSRTGFADVSGVCTVQLPDIVALCFVLNRQNIDGVSRVSASIREQLKDKVKVRAIPMRVARLDTSEESDARARAISDLTRIGQFSPTEVVEDIKSLQIITEENMPFYETLAPLITEDPRLHPLSLHYLRMTQNLLGIDLNMPVFNEDFMELARRRLMPKQATLEYIKKLGKFETERALEELRNLVESALENYYEVGGVEVEYVRALIDATEGINDFVDPDTSSAVKSRAAELLRTLYAEDHQKWRSIFQKLLENIVDSYWYLHSNENAVSLFEELDGVLAESSTLANQLKRVGYKRKLVPFLARTGNESEEIEQVLAEADYLVDHAAEEYTTLAADQAEYLVGAKAEIKYLSAMHTPISPERRQALMLDALSVLNSFDGALSADSKNLMFSLNVRIAEYFSRERRTEAGLYLLNAFEIWPGGYWGVSHFSRIVSIIDKLNHESRPALAQAFLSAAIASQGDKSNLVNAYGHSTSGVLSLAESLRMLLSYLRVDSNTGETAGNIAEILDIIARSFLRRRDTVKRDELGKMGKLMIDVINRLQFMGIDIYSYQNLIRIRSQFE